MTEQIKGDVVERMLDAWTNAKDQDFSGTKGDCLACMTAAASVCQQDRDEQWEKACRIALARTWAGADDFIANVRHYMEPKPPSDRVKVRNQGSGWVVKENGAWVASVATERIANALRVGLIAQMEKEQTNG